MTGTEVSFLQIIAQLGGVGAVFAVGMFFIYRADAARYAKSVEDMNKALLAALEANTNAMIGVKNAVESQSVIQDLRDEIRGIRGEADRGRSQEQR